MIEIEIRCNDCGICGDSCSVRKASEIRKYLKRKEGWKVNLPGGKDLCPECLEKARREKDRR